MPKWPLLDVSHYLAKKKIIKLNIIKHNKCSSCVMTKVIPECGIREI